MKKKILSILLLIVTITTLFSNSAFAASNKTTVTAISQDTSAALDYLKENIGTVNGKWTIPGLNQTITRTSNGSKVTTCSSMTPQAIAFAGNGKYLLISAYCNCGKNHRSVIYVMSADSQKYLTTLILDTSCHVGGIACSGNYVWVCDSSNKCLRSYKYSSIEDAVGHNYWTLYTQSKRSVAATPSFLCYANGYLYEGTFSEKSTTCKIHYYDVNGKSLSKKGYITLSGISKIQGISIRGNYLLVTSSYGRKNKSQAYVFKDSSNKFKKSGKTYKASAAKKYKLPNMAEGCYIGSSYTYFLFESGAATYRKSSGTMPLDKYVRFKNSLFGIL